MADRECDDPLAGRCRKLLQREARLKRLNEHLLQDGPPQEPSASAVRRAPVATPDNQLRLTERETLIPRLLIMGSTNR